MNVMDDIFQSANKLPMLPKVVHEVMQLLNQPEVDTRKLVDTVSHDQVIAAKVLRLANSSYYGSSRTIKTLEDAILLIGMKTLNTLVIASGVTTSFKVNNIDMPRFWRHSLVTASVARALAREKKLEQETAYVAGLMHSIGQLMIHQVFPQAGLDIDEMCKGLSVLERKAVENSTLGLDHCQVGSELARRWNFPEDIQRVIRYYAEPLHINACALAPVVYSAAHIAFGLERKEEPDYIVDKLNPEVAKVVGLDLSTLAPTIETYQVFVAEADSFI